MIEISNEILVCEQIINDSSIKYLSEFVNSEINAILLILKEMQFKFSFAFLGKIKKSQ